VYILTASHLVAGADRLEIAAFSRKSYPRSENVYRSAQVVAQAADIRDLALVRLATADKGLGIVPLCSVAATPQGEGFSALAVGCTQGQAPTCAVNKVLGKRKVRQKVGEQAGYFWEGNAAGAKGRSGGPLIDKRGYVVGICSGTSDGKSYFTHPDEIHRFLKQHAFGWLADKENTEAPQGAHEDASSLGTSVERPVADRQAQEHRYESPRGPSPWPADVFLVIVSQGRCPGAGVDPPQGFQARLD
jgi:S1-C subfamily serine protease